MALENSVRTATSKLEYAGTLLRYVSTESKENPAFAKQLKKLEASAITIAAVKISLNSTGKSSLRDAATLVDSLIESASKLEDTNDDDDTEDDEDSDEEDSDEG